MTKHLLDFIEDHIYIFFSVTLACYAYKNVQYVFETL